jgi:alpha-mannosidase
LGRLKEAQEAVKVAGSLERAPSLKEVSDRTKYEHTWMRELYLDALKKAGYE